MRTENNITEIPSADCRELRSMSNQVIALAELYHRLSFYWLGLTVLGFAGFFVLSLTGQEQEMWLLSLSIVFMVIALMCKAAEVIYWKKYNSLRDHLAANVIEWINKLQADELY